MLLSNDQRHDTIGALGNPRIFTPNLDRLVKRGTAFTHAFVSDPWDANSIFQEELLTGRPVVINPRKAPGASWEGSDLQRIELARLFRDAGYLTVFVGAESPEGTPAQHGFTRSHAFEALPRSNDIYLLNAGKKTVAFSTNVYAEEAAKFIEERASEPWFMQVSFRAPHDPRKAPGKFGRMYEAASIPIPPNFMPEHPFDNGEMVIRDEELEAWPRKPDRIQQHLADSYGMVSHLDSQIGSILNSLESTRQLDDTIVVLASDNGVALGSHGLMGKMSLYEHTVRAPLILSGPGIPPGSVSEDLVCISDAYAAICELASIDSPPNGQTASLLTSIRGTSNDRDAVFAAYTNVQRMIRTKRWKLIRYPRVGISQLFDLESDPWETANLLAPWRRNNSAKLKTLDLSEIDMQAAALGDRLEAWERTIDPRFAG